MPATGAGRVANSNAETAIDATTTATSANMPQAKKCLGRFHSCSLIHFASFADALDIGITISDIRYKDSPNRTSTIGYFQEISVNRIGLILRSMSLRPVDAVGATC